VNVIANVIVAVAVIVIVNVIVELIARGDVICELKESVAVIVIVMVSVIVAVAVIVIVIVIVIVVVFVDQVERMEEIQYSMPKALLATWGEFVRVLPLLGCPEMVQQQSARTDVAPKEAGTSRRFE
jgi:predicted PurR-regulated permease PerM